MPAPVEVEDEDEVEVDVELLSPEVLDGLVEPGAVGLVVMLVHWESCPSGEFWQASSPARDATRRMLWRTEERLSQIMGRIQVTETAHRAV